jgi:hypothetical protein
MRRYAAAALLLGTLSGCFNLDTGPESGGYRPLQAQGAGPPTVPGMQGPNGLPVPMAAPYKYNPPVDMYAAQEMMRHTVPLNMVQMNGPGGVPGMPPTVMPNGGILSPPGMPFAPGAPSGGSVNPTSLQTITPGPGTSQSNGSTGDIQLAQFALNPAAAGVHNSGQRTQVRFTKPIGMQVSWFAQAPDGRPIYSPTPIDTPGKYNFVQGARYRLKLTNIPGRPGLELYPTLEVAVANHKAEAFLAHSNVPVEFTEEDFKQVAEGNYLVKVIYLPDPQFQDVAGTGTDEILSTRLEPGQDPLQEALRRGSILLVIRMGNIDQEAPNTPPLSQPGPAAGPPMAVPGLPPGAPGGPGMPQHLRFGPTMPGVLPSPVQQPYWGFPPPAGNGPGPNGPAPNGAGLPPGGLPPGLIPPVGPVPPVGPTPPFGPMPPFGPLGPVPPMGPTAPMGPLGPVPPMGPLGPVPPIGPLGPVPPMGPTVPFGPVGPAPTFNPVAPQSPIPPVGPGVPSIPGNVPPSVPPSAPNALPGKAPVSSTTPEPTNPVTPASNVSSAMPFTPTVVTPVSATESSSTVTPAVPALPAVPSLQK